MTPAAQAKVTDNLTKQENRTEQITEATRKLSFAEGQVTRLTNATNKRKAEGTKNTVKQNEELAKAKQLVGELKNEIKNANSSQRLLTQSADQYADNLKDAERNVARLDRRVKNLKAPRGFERIFGGRGGNNLATAGAAGLGAALPQVALGAALAAAAIQAIRLTSEFETQQRSLQVLVKDLRLVETIISDIQQFAAATPFTSSELIDVAKRLKAFGIDNEKLVETTRRLGDVAGATGSDINGIATAYGQIAAKGRLQGEELLQLQERGIALQPELQRMYKLTGEEFRKALERPFSAAAVEEAFRRLTNIGGVYANGANAQSDTLAGKFSTLVDRIETLARPSPRS